MSHSESCDPSRRQFLTSAAPALAGVSAAAAPGRTCSGEYDAKEFGAAGDGRTDDTAAIQAALDAAHAAGGGTVRIPAGTYVTRTLTLYSKVHLAGLGDRGDHPQASRRHPR